MINFEPIIKQISQTTSPYITSSYHIVNYKDRINEEYTRIDERKDK